MGRKTYERISEFGEYPYKNKKAYVFSNSFNLTKDEEIGFVGENIVDFTKKLQLSEGKGIWLVGGSEIIKLLLKSKVVNEIIISIHPIILGDGIPLFLKFDKPTYLSFKNCINFNSGLVQLHYEVL